MKNKYLTPFISVIILIITCSCNNSIESQGSKIPVEETNYFPFDSLNTRELNKLLKDRWKWEHSIIMSRGILPPYNLITPETAGYTIEYDFISGGKLNIYKNHHLQDSHTYEVKRFKVIPQDNGYVTEILIDTYPSQLRFFHPDTMMIGNGWSDGIDGYYSRIQK